MSPARTDEGFHRLQELAALLDQLNRSGEEVRIIGCTIMTRSGRVGWASKKDRWVVQQYPKRG